jgi:hypothetical protein
MLWEVSLSLHSLPQPLCFSQFLLGDSGSSRQLACQQHPIYPPPPSTFAVLWCITESLALRAQFLARPDNSAMRSDLCHSPILQGRSAFHPHLQCWCQITVHCLWLSVLLGGGSVCPGAVLDFFPGMGRVAMSGVQCLPICSAVSRRLLWSQLAGRNGMVVFS